MGREKKFLQGNDAIALGALYAGCRFFAGYPITPSTEVAEKLASMLPKVGGRFIQMEDEIAAMAAIIGASLAGKKSLTATSGPGMSLKMENLGFGCIAEVPCVILNVMRGGPSTGTPTGPGQSDIMQAKWGPHGDHPCIAITPSTVTEQFTETVRAFNLSEKYRTPVIILTDEIIGHMRESIEIPEKGELEVFDRVKPSCSPAEYMPYDSSKGDVPPMANFGEGYRYHVTGLNHDATGFPTSKPELIESEEKRLIRKVEDNYDDIVKVEEFMCSDADRIVFAFGSSARSAKDAVIKLREKGIKAGLLKAITIWPFPDKHIEKYASKGIKGIIVPELNLGQATREVERATKGKCKVEGLFRVDSEAILPLQISESLERL